MRSHAEKDVFVRDHQPHVVRVGNYFAPPFQRADFDWTTANTVWCLGRLDDAEPFAASAALAFGDHEHCDGVKARLTLATIQVQAGAGRADARPPGHG